MENEEPIYSLNPLYDRFLKTMEEDQPTDRRIEVTFECIRDRVRQEPLRNQRELEQWRRNKKKASEHPAGYSLGHSRFLTKEWKWAQWAKEHAWKESVFHTKWRHRKDPPISLPSNWKGPVLVDGMSQQEKQAWEKLMWCEVLEQGLRRCYARSQRPFMKGLIKSIDFGLADKDFDIQFHPDEKSEDGHRGLKRIRNEETAWLVGLSRETPLRFYEYQDPSHLGTKGRVFLDRVLGLVQDLSPTALFYDNELKSMEDFRRELNNLRKKEGGGIAFSPTEVIYFAEKMEQMEILRLEWYEDDGFVALATPRVHWENAIRWPEEAQADEDTGEDTDSETSEELFDPGADEADHLPYNERPEEREEPWEDEAIHLRHKKRPTGGQATKSKADIRSTAEGGMDYDKSSSAMISNMSFDDDKDYNEAPYNTPNGDRMLDLEDLWTTNEDPVQQAATWRFYQCLGYRFGQTLRLLRGEVRAISYRLTDHDLNRINHGLVRTAIGFWLDDTAKRPNRPEKNGAGFPGWKPGDYQPRITPKYQDIVKEMMPEPFEDTRNEPIELTCAEIVQKGLLTEAHQNRSTRSLVEPPRFDPDPFVRPPKIELDEEDDQPLMTANCMWYFGDPRIKRKSGKRWFDVNRWPRQAPNSPIPQEAARASNDHDCSPRARRLPLSLEGEEDADNLPDAKKDENEMNDLRAYVGARTLEGDGEGGPSRDPFYRAMPGQHIKRLGGTHYWEGDTELQKAAVIDRIKRRFETAPSPPPSPPPPPPPPPSLPPPPSDTITSRLLRLFGRGQKRKREEPDHDSRSAARTKRHRRKSNDCDDNDDETPASGHLRDKKRKRAEDDGNDDKELAKRIRLYQTSIDLSLPEYPEHMIPRSIPATAEEKTTEAPEDDADPLNAEARRAIGPRVDAAVARGANTQEANAPGADVENVNTGVSPPPPFPAVL